MSFKKSSIVLLMCLALAAGLSAQQRTGNINGTVTDQDGTPLPGVTVTLSGSIISAIPTTTSAEGKFRFLSLSPSSDYEIKLELQGFKTKIETGIIVNMARNSDFTFILEMGKLEEQVTVVAQTPVVQAKKVQVTHTVNYEQLQGLPTSRDPWFVLQMTPSIFVDRENMAGSESGQMAGFMARGTTSNEWNMDGIQTTDMASSSAPGYYDFDSFEEMNVSIGQLDVEHRSPGVVVNLVTRRGGNRTSLAGRFYLTDRQFQGEITKEELAEIGVPGYNRVNEIKDIGFNLGGPVIKDKVWWWGSYGIQNILTWTTTGVKDDSYLTNLNIKLNFQIIPQNRAEVSWSAGKKEKFGRSSSFAFPSGYNQSSPQRFGNPTMRIQDEHMFGDSVFLSLRFGHTDGGFQLIPANDMEISKVRYYDYEKDLNLNTYSYAYYERPHTFAVAQLQYFNDNFLGTGSSHEMKFGFELNNNTNVYYGHNPGNFYIRTNYYTQTVDWDGNGTRDIVRDLPEFKGTQKTFNYTSFNRSAVETAPGTKRLAGYFNDTISFGRFTVNAGIRADRNLNFAAERVYQALWTEDDDVPLRSNYYEITRSIMTEDTIQKVAALLPTNTIPYIEQQKTWLVFSPRVGLSYDVFGTGKTIAKLAWSLYPGAGLGTAPWDKSGAGGSVNFYWADLNADKMMHWSELYWYDYSKSARPAYRAFDDAGNFVGNVTREFGAMWSGFDWNNPLKLTDPYTTYDLDNYKVSLTTEYTVSIEQELMKDFGVSLSYNYRTYGRYAWSRPYYPADKMPTISDPNHIRSQDDYMIGGYVPAQLVATDGTVYDTKDAAGRPWYVLKNLDYNKSTSYSYYTMAPDNYYDDYWGIDLVFNKRLSDRWMANGSVTYQMQKVYWGDAYTDPTNKWAYDGSVYGISLGSSSGKVGANFFSRWMFKLAGLYQLPWDVNVSGTLSAREGAFVGESFGISDTTLPNTQSQSSSLPTSTYDHRTRLNDVWTIDLKIEKAIRLSDTGKVYFSVDFFNATNSRIILRQYDNSYGSFRQNDGYWAKPGVNNNKPNEIMNPFIFRFGVRFQI